MQGEQKERWLELCEQAANEDNCERLVQLVKEINRLLEEKENLLKKSRLPRQRDCAVAHGKILATLTCDGRSELVLRSCR